MSIFDDLGERHPSVTSITKYLVVNPNLPEPQATIARRFEDVAYDMCNGIADSPELTAGLRKLLEAKDCFVRASLDLKRVDYRDR